MLLGGYLMAVKMLVFDFRETEKEFFDKNEMCDNFDITFINESLNDETVKALALDALENTAIISVFINSEITQEVINAFTNLRIISTRSTGIDHIDHKAADERNIAIINVEGYGSKSVAQYTIGLMIALSRHIVPASKHVLQGGCNDNEFVGRDISNLTIGILGTGAIGSAVAKLACAFGMKVLTYDLNEKLELITNYNVKYTNFENIIKQSDIITLHLPYTGKNYHLLSKKEFEMMKPTAFVINTSRGEILDTFALYEALVNNTIQGAALDVVVCESLSFKCENYSERLGDNLDCVKEAEIVKKLADMRNVIVTPHIAYETQDAIDYILETTFKSILEIIKSGKIYDA